MTFFQSILLAIIEGLTEFLPVSSTGHMILASSLMKISEDEFSKTFEIAIQLGAIMAVVVVYFKRFLAGSAIYLKLFIAFVPTAIIGKLAYKTIKASLFNPYVVSSALIIGGVILILLDKWSERENAEEYESIEDISLAGAFKIGLFQCLSMIPGVSRAAATIFGGIFSGFNRKQAAEFSFLLAIPTMFAATGYDLLKTDAHVGSEQLTLLLIGSVVAFVFAFIVIKTFISIVARFGFKHFGYYRIILGAAFLIYAYMTGLQLIP